MNYKQKIGEFGENLAKDYLKRKGYEIVDRNWKNSHHEIDIIARFEGKVIFVEVKTRTTDTFGRADEQMSAKKINNLKKALFEYLDMHNFDQNNCRLDLVAIDINKQTKLAKIKHYKDLF